MAQLDLDDMRVLVVLGEELHFGRAAARLHLSQPGLSYRVKRMEDALGYELLARTRRSVTLTPAGAAVLQGSHRLLDEARRLVDDGGRVARGEVAALRVGFVGTALYGLLPPVLREARFDPRFPVELVANDLGYLCGLDGDTPMSAAALAGFHRAAGAGLGADDLTAIARLHAATGTPAR